MKVWLALIVLWTAAVPAFAQTDSDTSGTGTSHGFAVSDGDTVKFGKQRVRLFGIDAPEKGQPCDDGHWYPGPLATKALVAIIAGRPVPCRQVDYDYKNNRPVATCFAGKDDLQALMVGAGWAWAYTAFSDQYVDAERRAAARGVGVYAHHLRPAIPWYELARFYRENREKLLKHNDNFVLRGYWEITRQYLIRPVFVPVHPTA